MSSLLKDVKNLFDLIIFFSLLRTFLKSFGTTFNHIDGFEETINNQVIPITSTAYKRSDQFGTYENFWKSEEFSLLNLEGQLHGDLRGLVAKAFSTRQVQELRPFTIKNNEFLFLILSCSFKNSARFCKLISVLGSSTENVSNSSGSRVFLFLSL